MKERPILILLAALSLSACNEQKDNASNTSSVDSSGRSYSVFGQIRPKVDPAVVREIEQEDLEKQKQRQAELEKQLAAQNAQSQSGFLNPADRNLPDVNTSPISGAAQPVNGSAQQMEGAPPASQPMDTTAWQPPGGTPAAPPQASSYGMNYTSPTPSVGFVPPPPAVTVTGSVSPYGAPPPPQMYAQAPYPYYNPYQQQPPQYQPPEEKPARGPGSLFGSGGSASSSTEEEDESRRSRRDRNVVVITPVGMQPYSPFKQRDDLKALWQGSLGTSALSSLTRDEKINQQLRKVEVSTPTEATRGQLSVPQRTIDSLFKNASVDKKFVAQVKKCQSDLIQAYYRYLFSYNKFSLTQQNVAARKQEVELADSSAEKQRAAADLAQAQQEAESSKDDMRTAQGDLASVAGAQSARLIIGRVSGVAPSLESLAQAEPDRQDQQQANSIGGFFNSVGSAFGIGKKQEPREEEKVARAETTNNKGKDKEKKGKDNKKGKADKTQIAAAPPSEPPVPSRSTSVESAAVSPAPPQGAVSFELKDVKTTPRKSILRVSIRNNGDENFSFDTDSVSVAEGNKKLADAAVRAEFDATIVQPNQEVTGTVTIFGLPWNDRLSVSLSDGGKTILLHR
ncbi:MAG: hypothetical protein K2W95_27110 [Candidatus Obscuribacterales bacterium]|nr:hypothetical protein [Candidatus Obscuribacterales bacterium]